MTIEKALDEIENINHFCGMVCDRCEQDEYCLAYCDTLMKAKSMDFDKIVKKYAEYDGDVRDTLRYIKRASAKFSDGIKIFRPYGGFF